MRVAVVIVCVAAAGFGGVGCRKADGPGGQQIVVGGLYACPNDDGTYGVMKVLALDESAVHLRIYRNKFNAIPEDLDTSTLSLGRIDDPEGFGIGHLPMAREGFWQGGPVFVKREGVREEELDGYRIYLEAQGTPVDL